MPRKEIAELAEGERSAWIEEKFVDSHGEQKRERFYFYLIRLKGREDFRLYHSAINPSETLTLPPELTGELTKAAGPYMEVDDFPGLTWTGG